MRQQSVITLCLFLVCLGTGIGCSSSQPAVDEAEAAKVTEKYWDTAQEQLALSEYNNSINALEIYLAKKKEMRADRLVEACYLIGLLNRFLNRFEMAHKNLAQAQLVAERTKSPSGQAKAFTEIGVVSFLEGDWDRAQNSWEKSLEICREHALSNEQVQALSWLAWLNINRSQIDMAEKRLNECHSLMNSEFPLVIQLEHHFFQGQLQQKLGNYAAAREHYDQAFLLSLENKNLYYNAWLVLNLGQLDQLEGKWASAKNQYTAALSTSRAIRNGLFQAAALVGLAEYYEHNNDLDAAFSRLSDAFTIYDELKPTPAQAKAKTAKARFLRQQGKIEEAYEEYRQAENIYAQFQLKEQQAFCLTQLGGLITEIEENGFTDQADEVLRIMLPRIKELYEEIGQTEKATEVQAWIDQIPADETETEAVESKTSPESMAGENETPVDRLVSEPAAAENAEKVGEKQP